MDTNGDLLQKNKAKPKIQISKQNYKLQICKLSIDTVQHLLLECEPVQEIWKAFENFLALMNINRKLNRDMILYNYFETGQQKNIILSSYYNEGI